MKNDTWKPVTHSADPKTLDPRGHINFELTPEERAIAVLARIEIIGATRQQFTPGVVVKHVHESELTESERKAFGIGGAA